MVNRARGKGRSLAPGAALAGLVILLLPGAAEARQEGEELFRTNCAPCHSVGAERILGPGLAGVTERRDHDWLIRKITEPEQLARERDPITLSLIEEYALVMVGLGLTSGQAETILAYLSEVEAAPRPVRPAEEVTFTPEQSELGRLLFDGAHRPANRGSGCGACHDVSREGVLGGGSLAVDLTDAYSRMGPDALAAMMRAPPFPVMRRAYQDRPLTDEEIQALVAFLQRVETDPHPRGRDQYGLMLAGAGLLGTLLLAGLFTMTWRGRRRGSVNREIFERQVKSR